MKTELQKHKKSDKVKWVLTGIAFVLVFVFLIGLCMQLFAKDDKYKPSEWFKPTEKTQSEGEAFVVTPQNGSSAIRLTSYSVENYSETALTENERIIKVDTPYYDGAINWSIDYTGEVVHWAAAVPSATECVSITAIDSRTYKVTCLRDFGQQIKLTASREDFPDKKDSCVCDYLQRYTFDEVYIGFNSFKGNGNVSRAPTAGIMEISSPSLTVYDGESLEYSVEFKSSSYTELMPAPTNCEGLNFEFTFNEDWITQFGLEKYSFKCYSQNFNDSLSGTIDGFFNRSWFEYGVSGTSYSVDEFASDLMSATDESGFFGIDSVPAYTLSISGLPDTTEVCRYDVYFDLYELSIYVEKFATLTVDTPQIDF